MWTISMLLVQANLDDMNPEWITYLMDKLFDVGANDVLCCSHYYEAWASWDYAECAC